MSDLLELPDAEFWTAWAALSPAEHVELSDGMREAATRRFRELKAKRRAPTAGPESIVDRINEHHRVAFCKAGEALESARQAGLLLIEAKAALKHGEWLPWLEANIEFSARTAAGYMRLATRWDALKANSQPVADLGLRDALALLAERPAGRDDAHLEAKDASGPASAELLPEERETLDRVRSTGVCSASDDKRLTAAQRRLMHEALASLTRAIEDGIADFSAEDMAHALDVLAECLQLVDGLEKCDGVVAILALTAKQEAERQILALRQALGRS